MHTDEIAKNLPALIGALFVSILFVQSALDKVFDWSGNLEWLTGHFSKTFVAGMVPAMLVQITVLEMAAGVISALGFIYLIVAGSTLLIFLGATIGAASITALFFGQRISKDYAGAAVLVPYFILMVVLMVLTSPFQPAK